MNWVLAAQIGIITGLLLQAITLLGIVWAASKFVTERREKEGQILAALTDLRQDQEKHIAKEEVYFEQFRQRFHEMGNQIMQLVAADVRAEEQIRSLRDQVRGNK